MSLLPQHQLLKPNCLLVQRMRAQQVHEVRDLVLREARDRPRDDRNRRAEESHGDQGRSAVRQDANRAQHALS